jgi:predicted regulator of Ras-like GTPase activity (Roadblock/LC7/MglB family)
MDRDPYTSALYNALNEIKKAYPDITHSFIFSENGATITRDQETKDEDMKVIMDSFDILRDKSKIIGNLQGFQINGKNSKLILSNIKDKYLVLETTRKLDETQIYAITHMIIPTILKTLETLGPTAILSQPSKKLVVDTLGGFFAGNSVEIYAETLKEWTENSHSKDSMRAHDDVKQVHIETSDGKSAYCDVKKISYSKMKGKNLIKIPKKLCKNLKIEKGDFVLVKPTVEGDAYDR